MSATMPMKAQPRRNPLLTMARYMSDAGADGYAGLTLLYHQTTTQLIIQWTGVDISQPEKIEAEQNLLKLLKGCEVIDANEDVEPLDFDDPEPGLEMNDDNAVSEMESINFTEPASPEFEVKKEPEEMSQSQCNKSVSSGEGDASFGSFTVNPLEFSGSSLTTSNSPVNSTSHTTPNPIVFPGMERLPKRPVTTVGQTSSTSTYPTTAHTGTSSAAATSVSIKEGLSHSENHKQDGASSDTRMFAMETTYSCHRCNFTSKYGHEFNAHILRCTAKKQFQCPFCFIYCSDKNKFIVHISNHRVDATVTRPSPLPVVTRPSPAIPCPQLTRQPISPTSKCCQCSVCFTEFTSRSALTRHMRRHTGITPFSCDFCDKKFSRKDSAMEHKKSHILKMRKEHLRSLSASSHPLRPSTQLPSSVANVSEGGMFDGTQPEIYIPALADFSADSPPKTEGYDPSLQFPVFPS